MLEHIDITRILGIGIIGLGFLLAFLAFRLLNREQAVAKPRETILKAINRFMIFSVGLCIIGLSSELYRLYQSPASSPKSELELQQGVNFPLTSEETQATRAIADEFLSNLDKGMYQQALDAAPQQVKKNLSLEDFRNQAIRTAELFGPLKARKFFFGQKTPGPTPEGGVAVLYTVTFVSSYEKITNAADMVTLIKADDTYHVINYNKY